MSKNPGTETAAPTPIDLRGTCFKLRGLIYLLERADDEEDQALYGLSLILAEIHEDVLAAHQAIEAEEFRSAQIGKPASGKRAKSSGAEDSQP